MKRRSAEVHPGHDLEAFERHQRDTMAICFRLLDIVSSLTGDYTENPIPGIQAGPNPPNEDQVKRINETLDGIQERLASDASFKPAPLPAELTQELATLKASIEELKERIPSAASGLRPNVEFFSSSPRPLDGIIRHLCRGAGSFARAQELKLLVVHASPHKPSEGPPLLFDDQDTTYFRTLDGTGPDQWLCFDFNELRVTVAHGTMRPRHDLGKDAGHHLKSWVLEGSETGDTGSWFPLDFQYENEDLNYARACPTFTIRHPDECRLVRLRALGNSYGSNHLILSGFELFGSLSSPAPIPQ
jgi:hypothetical protein